MPGGGYPLLDAPTCEDVPTFGDMPLTDTAKAGGIASASLLAAWDACADGRQTGFRGLVMKVYYWAKKKRRTR